MKRVIIRQLDGEGLMGCLKDLTDILLASVQNGASVGFILPYEHAESRAFWNDDIKPLVTSGSRQLFVAWVDQRVVGTVQLGLAEMPNQKHRCEVAKLLVHPGYRGQGIAKNLMHVLEDHARKLGKHLITLDTRTGDAAEPLYRSLGYQTAGMIPDYCRAPEEDRYESTTYMYKVLS